jgi:class 3 adenylate cyclase
MARFARDCLYKMKNVTTQLEETLAPDTGNLGIRIRMHSGPVKARVLVGNRARIQLFGDTMNTTARIETTGTKNIIHLSEETAQLLREAEHWIRPKEETVVAKGKGELTTYWLYKADGPGTSHSGSSCV